MVACCRKGWVFRRFKNILYLIKAAISINAQITQREKFINRLDVLLISDCFSFLSP